MNHQTAPTTQPMTISELTSLAERLADSVKHDPKAVACLEALVAHILSGAAIAVR